MPDWTAFGAVAGFVLLLVLGLARVTTATVGEAGAGSTGETRARTGESSVLDDQQPHAPGAEPPSVGADHWTSTGHGTEERATSGAGTAESAAAEAGAGESGTADAAADSVAAEQATPPAAHDPSGAGAQPAEHDGLPPISSLALLGNVVVTHGVLSVVLVGAAAMTEVPFAAFGVSPLSSAQWTAVAGGVGLGLALAGANAAVAANLDRFGIEYSESLRTSLAPDSAGGWGLLFVATLPLVAVFEELLFRGVLIGAAAAGTGLSPWWFVLPSSALFAAGHGLQGRGGVLVTGALGAVLGAAFAATGSLLLVVVAHYVVNAVEFATHELLGVDPRAWLAV